MFTQCKLEQRRGDQTVHLTTYIPQKHAKLHKLLKVKDKDGIWKVISIGTTVDRWEDPRWIFKTHKDNTGDSWEKP